MARITSIICTYRRPRLLARALASLAAQTVPAESIRVFDNASGDETPAVIKWFQQRGLPIEYHCHPENIGYQRNFTFAMTRSLTTEFCHLLNDDDFVLGDLFALSLAAHARVPGAIFSAARTAWLTTDGVVEEVPLRRWDREVFSPGEAAAYLLERGHPEFTAMVYRASWLRETGGLDFETYGSACDVPFHLLAAARGPVVAIPRTGGVYWKHPEQASHLESESGRAIFKRIFETLVAGAFADPVRLRATLAAAAMRHIYLQRHLPGSLTGMAREARGVRAAAELIRLRPSAAAAVLVGFGKSVATILQRRVRDDASASREEVCREATAEIATYLQRIEHDFIEPCCKELGLAVISQET